MPSENLLMALEGVDIKARSIPINKCFDSFHYKPKLDIIWLKDKSLVDVDNLPDPEDLATDIIVNLEAGLESFREIMVKLNSKE